MGISRRLVLEVVSLLLLLASSARARSSSTFDITRYDAKSDIISTLEQAWKDACSSTSPGKLLIPKGTHSLGAVTFDGPCKSSIEFQVQGTVQAPANPKSMDDSWITFDHVDQLTINGGGTFDGQGQIAWKQNDCGQNANCKALPINLRFNYVTNGLVTGVTSLNSKNFHVSLLGCQNLTFQDFTVTAPAESINTDGIHIGRSNGINIIDTKIGTGDDCISIGDGAQNVNATRVTCGPGHGISVGSLGKYANEQPVIGVYVTNCTISNAENGVRIKTWPAMQTSVASNMQFEDIIMNNVSNPIVLDQWYCPWNQCNLRSPSKVKISNVAFKNIRGTAATPVAVKLNCSSAFPCEHVEISDIDLKYTGGDGSATSECSNVNPIKSGKLPPGC